MKIYSALSNHFLGHSVNRSLVVQHGITTKDPAGSPCLPQRMTCKSEKRAANGRRLIALTSHLIESKKNFNLQGEFFKKCERIIHDRLTLSANSMSTSSRPCRLISDCREREKVCCFVSFYLRLRVFSQSKVPLLKRSPDDRRSSSLQDFFLVGCLEHLAVCLAENIFAFVD